MASEPANNDRDLRTPTKTGRSSSLILRGKPVQAAMKASSMAMQNGAAKLSVLLSSSVQLGEKKPARARTVSADKGAF